MLSAIFFKGFFTGLSLIIAIGAQNAFVLYQGLKRNYTLTVATTCSIIDIILITLGCIGLGTIINQNPIIHKSALYFGITFLIGYGFKSFYNATKDHSMTANSDKEIKSYKHAILTSIAFSLLNPHVYLDTVVLLGSISSQYDSANRIYFALGACTASLVWFTSLAYGSKGLSRFFNSSKSWKIMDIIIGTIMWIIAYSLYKSSM